MDTTRFDPSLTVAAQKPCDNTGAHADDYNNAGEVTEPLR